MEERLLEDRNRRVVPSKGSGLDRIVYSVAGRDPQLGEVLSEAVEAWRERGERQRKRKLERQARAMGSRGVFAGY